MKFTTYFTLIFVTTLCSCNSNKKEKTTQVDNVTKSNIERIDKEPRTNLYSNDGETENKTNPDSIPTFRVDDYPLKNKIFKGNYGAKKSGEIVSYDKVWLTN